jgi:hypothetical protein
VNISGFYIPVTNDNKLDTFTMAKHLGLRKKFKVNLHDIRLLCIMTI